MRIEWADENRQTVVWSLRKKELAVLLAFAGTDETRPNLSALYFNEAKGTIAATDGHRAVRMYGRRSENLRANGPTFVAPLAYCMQLHKSTRESPGATELFVEVDLLGNEARLVPVGQAGERVRSLDCTAPAFDVVIPKKRDPKEWRGVSAQLNSAYLADLHLISIACVYKRKAPKQKDVTIRPSVTLEPPPDELSPWVARCASSVYQTEWEAVIMPMRG